MKGVLRLVSTNMEAVKRYRVTLKKEKSDGRVLTCERVVMADSYPEVVDTVKRKMSKRGSVGWYISEFNRI